MGYPMRFARMTSRNRLDGGYPRLTSYSSGSNDDRSNIRGDIQRVELDMVDDTFAPRFAAMAGITVEQYRAVMRAFFDHPEPDCAECQKRARSTYESDEASRNGVGPWGPAQVRGRCSEHTV